MILSTCLLALALVQGSPPKADPELPKAYANLETMRRMLVRKLGEKTTDIGAKPATEGATEVLADTDGDGFPDSKSTRPPGNVTTDFLRARSYGTGETIIASHSEYVPGLAAVFSLTVPVRTDASKVKEEPKAAKPKPASEDDADWEALAKGDDGRAWRTYFDLVDGRGGANAATMTQSYAPEALAALRKTVIDTMWRFGHKLELGHGERLAVVVTVMPASATRMTWAGDNNLNSFGRGFGPGSGSSSGGADGGVVWAAPPPPQRVVFQISADDLESYNSGDLEPDELAKKTRVQSFAMPADEAPAPRPGSSLAR